jgi:hypothetical protein
MEVAFLSITPIDGTEQRYGTITDTIDFDTGVKDVEFVPTLSGGRIAKFMPEEPTEMTLEAYPLEVGNSTATTAAEGFFGLKYSEDASGEPQLIQPDYTRTKHRVSMLWTEDLTVAGAETQPAQDDRAMRLVFADVYVTNVDPEFTDDELKFTITLKVAPFDKQGNTNYQFESQAGDGMNQLTSLSSYTTSNKF